MSMVWNGVDGCLSAVWSIGRTKASVFPVPVGAWMSVSWRANTVGIAWARAWAWWAGAAVSGTTHAVNKK
jgi:hypothetical protein